MRINKILFLIFLNIFFIFNLFSEYNLQNKLIDVFGGDFHDKNVFSVESFFYKDGGIVNWFNYGIVNSVNIGLSLDFYNFIGQEDPKLRVPQIYAKFRIYNGDMFSPKFYIGYSGQGYGKKVSNKTFGKYETKEKGIFFAIERELLLENLIFNCGINIYDFKEKNLYLYGFISSRYLLVEKVLFMLEYDNIHSAPCNKLNFGIKYFINNNFSLGLGVKDLKDLCNHNDKTIERVFMFNYSVKIK